MRPGLTFPSVRTPQFLGLFVYLIAPTVLALAAAVVITLMSGFSSVGDVVGIILLIAVSSYAYGGVGALLTGVTMMFVVKEQRRAERVLLSGVMGGTCTAVWILALYFLVAPMVNGPSHLPGNSASIVGAIPVSFLIGLIGFITGALCGWITNRWMTPPRGSAL